MLERIRVEDVPEDAHLCPDLLEKYKEFVKIQYYGLKYYLPLPANRKLKKMVEQATELEFEDYLRSILHAIYLQIRDTVGSEVHESLSRDIQEGLAKLFSENLGHAIIDKMDQKLLHGGDHVLDNETLS